MITAQERSASTIRLIRRFIAQTFNVPKKQIPRVLFHGAILSSIIAGFWLLDALKDPVLSETVGLEYQPIAKVLSVVTTLFTVCVYDFLTSLVSKITLFHIVSGYFGIVVMLISALLTDPAVGLPNKSIGSHRLLGWFTYFTIETYGSLMVAMFWSFTNSIMDLEQAKGVYGLIIALAQVGAIIGSTLATNASSIGISQLFMMSSVMIFSVSLLMKCYQITFKDEVTENMIVNRVRSISEVSDTSVEQPLNSAQQSEAATTAAKSSTPIKGTTTSNSSISKAGNTSKVNNGDNDDDYCALPAAEDGIGEASATTTEKLPVVVKLFLQSIQKVFGGFSEGLSLVFRHPYMLKVMGVSCLYEVVVTILDYEFKVMGNASVQRGNNIEAAEDEFANLLGHFGQFTNILSFLLSLFGFSYFVHHIGVKYSLLIFPVTMFIAVVITNLVPRLWVLFVMVSIMKAMIFSLHDPVKELLYIPTSEAIKFKAKAWIDVFGARLAKAAGSSLCSYTGANATQLRRIAEIPQLVLAIIIVAVTWLAGEQFQALIDSKTVIGDETATAAVDAENLALQGKIAGELLAQSQAKLPVRNGLMPGDVGYDGYDLELFNGVFDDADSMKGSATKTETVDKHGNRTNKQV